MNLSREYESLYYKTVQVLVPFVMFYLCETGFSALATMKTKYRAKLVVEKEIRVALPHCPQDLINLGSRYLLINNNNPRIKF